MPSTPLRGAHLLRTALGRQLRGVRRWVLDLGGANNELGHGITELSFDDQTLTFKPGPNEDYIVVEASSADSSAPDETYYTEIDLKDYAAWVPPSGHLKSVDLLSDGIEDVGVVFHFESGEPLLIALTDTDLILARDRSIFEGNSEVEPVLRETIK